MTWTPQQWLLFFRSKFKIVSGGPAGTTGGTRSQGVIDSLMKLTEALPVLADPDAVPAAKRAAVADAIIAQTSSGGQGWLDEPDATWYRAEFLDDRIDAENMVYRCLKRASDPSTPTVPRFRWVRTVVE